MPNAPVAMRVRHARGLAVRGPQAEFGSEAWQSLLMNDHQTVAALDCLGRDGLGKAKNDTVTLFEKPFLKLPAAGSTSPTVVMSLGTR